MENNNLTPEQLQTIKNFEYTLASINDYATVNNAFRNLIKDIPNNYDLGEVIRRLFNQ